MNLPSMLKQGQRSRLFPVLADTSKEGRTLSVFLSCLEIARPLAALLLGELGHRIGPRATIETYTEVVFQKQPKDMRPDGLIVLNTGTRQWTALIEAKVGSNDLKQEQIQEYIDLAKSNGIDAVITISNEFTAMATHHPLELPASMTKGIALHHWSWVYLLTETSLLLSNDDIQAPEQKIIVNELRRFLTHPSAGVKRFEQMPAAWTETVELVHAGGGVQPTSERAKEVVCAWHQEVSDLAMALSLQLNSNVALKISREHRSDPMKRQRDDMATLSQAKLLKAEFVVPDLASTLEVCADLQKRTISTAMSLKAPEDRKSAKARLNWLIRQVQDTKPDGLFVRIQWPRASSTTHPLQRLRDDVEAELGPNCDRVPSSFDVFAVKNAAKNFDKRRNFIVELEEAVPAFLQEVGYRLKAWSPSVSRPTIDPDAATITSIRDDAEESIPSHAEKPKPQVEECPVEDEGSVFLYYVHPSLEAAEEPLLQDDNP